MVRFALFHLVFVAAALARSVVSAEQHGHVRFLQPGNQANETATEAPTDAPVDTGDNSTTGTMEPTVMDGPGMDNSTETEVPVDMEVNTNTTATEEPMEGNSTTTAVPVDMNTEVPVDGNATEMPVDMIINATEVPVVDSNTTNVTVTDVVILDDLIFQEEDLTILAAAFNASGLVGALCTDCNYTLFAPTDLAFEKVSNVTLARLLEPGFVLHLQNLLAFHATLPSDDRVLSADLEDGMVLEMYNMENVTLNLSDESAALVVGAHFESQIVQFDLAANNGVMHKVESVFIPDFLVTDLVGLVNSSYGDQFTILFELFEVAGVGNLIGDSVFTVLAPTDEAFLALGNETLTNLRSEDGKSDLLKILTYHVIEGAVPSVLLEDGMSVTSYGDYELYFSVTNETVMVNNATVVVANVLANNGIVHAIDKVLTEPFPAPPTAPTVEAPVLTPMAVPEPPAKGPTAPSAPKAPAAAPVKTPGASNSGAGSMPSFAAATTAAAIAFAIV